MRKALFPKLIENYQHWVKHSDYAVLESLMQPAKEHWQEKACALSELFRDTDDKDKQNPEDLIAQYAL